MIIHPSDKEDHARWDALPFYDKVQTTAAERIAALKFQVRSWAEREIEAGHNPMFHYFIHAYPEWNHEECHSTIGEELIRVKHGKVPM